MNIFELFGVIAINNDGANKAIDGTASKANGLAQIFSNMGSAAVKVGKTVATGLAAGAAGIAALTTASVKNYAEYEQLKGGIETLFGESGATVMEYAQKAFETAGLSANEYMSTVTSFSSSLLQSLGGDTDAAAKVADMALTDMSDNANKMGTSMSLIQNAYQGFAKQNYTMLDNLKLGYGGTEKEMKRLLKDAEKIQKQNGKNVKYNMKNLDDIFEAIHVVQEEMGIAGATADEAATTISGSFNAARAAWDNLVIGMADGEQDIDKLLDTFVGSVKVAIGNVTKLLPTLVSSFSKLVQGIIPEIPAILESLLPSLIEGAVGLLAGLASALPNIAKVLIQQVPLIIDQIIQAAKNVFPALVQSISDIFSQIDFAALANQIKTAFTDLNKKIPQVLSDVGNTISTTWTTTVWPNIQDLFSTFFDITLPDWETIKNDITTNWTDKVWSSIQNLFGAAFGIDLPDWDVMVTDIKTAWETIVQPGISEFFRVLFNIQPPEWEQITSDLQEGWDTNVQPVIDGIVKAFSDLFSGNLTGAFESINGVIDFIVEKLTLFSDWCVEHNETIQNIAIVVGSFALALGLVNGALAIANGVSTGIGAFGTALASLTSPTGIAVLCIGLLIAAVILCIKYWDDIKEAVTNAFNTIVEWCEKNWTEFISKLQTNLIEPLMQKWEDIKSAVNAAFQAVKDWLYDTFVEPLAKFKANVIEPIAAAWSETVSGAISGAIDWVSSFMGIDLAAGWDKITNAVSDAWDTVIGKISSAISALKEFLGLDSGGHNEGRKFGNPFTGNASTNGDALNPTLQHAAGAVFSKPTLFDSRMGRHLVGEAGPEAVAPIGVLQGYVSEAVARQNSMLVSALDNIHEALLDMDANMGGHMREALNNTSLKVNEREFGRLVRTVV